MPNSHQNSPGKGGYLRAVQEERLSSQLSSVEMFSQFGAVSGVSAVHWS